MSIQEMKSQLHQLIDSAGDEPSLERLLDSAKRIIAGQSAQLATLTDFTDIQIQQLNQAMKDRLLSKL